MDHMPERIDGKQVGSLALHWRIFGSSNHTIDSHIPVTKRFDHREDMTHHNIKSIIRTEHFDGMKSPHNPYFLHGAVAAKTNGLGNFSEIGASSRLRVDDVAVLHHYKYKSKSEWYFKSCIRKRAIGSKNKGCGEDPLVGEVFDDSAWKMLKSRVPKYKMYDQWEDYS
eukprot:scaffold4326_cov59-Attheya_sp.AAC.1